MSRFLDGKAAQIRAKEGRLTNEKAVKYLQEVRTMYGHKWIKDACDAAIPALEKQIPKKPILKKPYEPLTISAWYCPVCGKWLGSEWHKPNPYCHHCGQALKRREE